MADSKILTYGHPIAANQISIQSQKYAKLTSDNEISKQTKKEFTHNIDLGVLNKSLSANDIEMSGNYSYNINGNYATLNVNKITNNRTGGTSGTLTIELWATASAYNGGNINGYRLASHSVGQLSGGGTFSNITSGTVSFSEPPAGSYFMTLLVSEYGSGIVDHGTFSDKRTFGGNDGGSTGSGIDMSGSFSYQINANTVSLSVDEIANNRSGGKSGTLSIELWATTAAYTGGEITGYKLADYTYGQLTGGQYVTNINSGAISLSTPPAGTYHISMIVEEYNNGIVDYGTFDETRTFGENDGGGTGSGIDLSGKYSYDINNSSITLNADKISNNRTSGVSGTLSIELWASTSVYSGGKINGYKVADHRLGELKAGAAYANISSGTVAFSEPPAGTYYITMLVTEHNNGIVDYGTFSETRTFGGSNGGGTGTGSGLDMSGNSSYEINGDFVTLKLDKIQNNRIGGKSGTLAIELWATASPYNGGNIEGYKLATFSLGQLTGGSAFSNISSGSVALSKPPAGTYSISMLLTEYSNGIVDYGSFSDLRTFDDTTSSGTGIEIKGNLSYQLTGDLVTLKLDEIINNRNNGTSGTLSVELWASETEFNGTSITGHKLASHSIGQLAASSSFTNISSGTISFTKPPIGTYYITMLVTEYGSGIVTSASFSDLYTVKAETLPPPTLDTDTSSDSSSGGSLNYALMFFLFTLIFYRSNILLFISKKYGNK
ncbi:hypothetical protein [Pseudoalteromonas denitrificans]|nr:hypothetical protein [Pseudoalteromonas denitrificans]